MQNFKNYSNVTTISFVEKLTSLYIVPLFSMHGLPWDPFTASRGAFFGHFEDRALQMILEVTALFVAPCLITVFLDGAPCVVIIANFLDFFWSEILRHFCHEKRSKRPERF